jgi:hypothetical protein
MSSLAEIRADVRQLLDDADSERFSDDTVINRAINRAASLLSRNLVDIGWKELVSNTMVSLVNGSATVPASEKIINVYYSSDSVGTALHELLSGSGVGKSVSPALNGYLKVEYVPKYVNVSNDGYTIEYCGLDLDDLVVDQLCAYMAADDLKTTEGDVNQLIKQKIKELQVELRKTRGNMVEALPRSRISYRYFNDYRWDKVGLTTIQVY